MRPALTSVAVFCGSNFGRAPAYATAAAKLGTLIAQRGLTLVYGGTNKGLMGVVADAALASGGTVVGVISRQLHERGHLYERLTRQEIAPDMRTRKARMSELANALIAMPGGLGTLDELFEAATLTQLGDHHKACGVLEVCGFYRPLRALLESLTTWTPPNVSKWISQPGS